MLEFSVLNNNTQLHIIKEIAIVAIIAAICYLIMGSLAKFLSWHFLLYLLLGFFIIAQYARVIVFERKVIWMKPFSMKFLIFLLNIPLFFLVLTWMMNFNGQLEDYGYDVTGMITQDLSAGMSLTQYARLKSITYFVGTATMITIILFQFRVIYSIFKYREIPSFLLRKESN